MLISREFITFRPSRGHWFIRLGIVLFCADIVPSLTSFSCRHSSHDDSSILIRQYFYRTACLSSFLVLIVNRQTSSAGWRPSRETAPMLPRRPERQRRDVEQTGAMPTPNRINPFRLRPGIAKVPVASYLASRLSNMNTNPAVAVFCALTGRLLPLTNVG